MNGRYRSSTPMIPDRRRDNGNVLCGTMAMIIYGAVVLLLAVWLISLWIVSSDDYSKVSREIDQIKTTSSTLCTNQKCQEIDDNLSAMKSNLSLLNSTYGLFLDDLWRQTNEINRNSIHVSVNGSDENEGTIDSPVESMDQAMKLVNGKTSRIIVVGPGNFDIDINFADVFSNGSIDRVTIKGTREFVEFLICDNLTSSYVEQENPVYIHPDIYPYDTICYTSVPLVPGELVGMFMTTGGLREKTSFITENTANSITVTGLITDNTWSIYKMVSTLNISTTEEFVLTAGVEFDGIRIRGNGTIDSYSKNVFSTCDIELYRIVASVGEASYFRGCLLRATGVIDIEMARAGLTKMERTIIYDSQISFGNGAIDLDGVIVKNTNGDMISFSGTNAMLRGVFIETNNEIRVQRSSDVRFVDSKIVIYGCDSSFDTLNVRESSVLSFGREDQQESVVFTGCETGEPDYNNVVVSFSSFQMYGTIVFNSAENGANIINAINSDISVSGKLYFEGKMKHLIKAESSRIFPSANEQLTITGANIDTNSTDPVIMLTSCKLVSFSRFGGFMLNLIDVPRGISISGGSLFWGGGNVIINATLGYAIRFKDQLLATYDSETANIAFNTISTTEPSMIVQAFSQINLRNSNYFLYSENTACIRIDTFSQLNYQNTEIVLLNCGLYEMDIQYESSALITRTPNILIHPMSANLSRIGALVSPTIALLTSPNGAITDGFGTGVQFCTLNLQ